MLEDCILIFGIAGSVALFGIVWNIWILAIELRGIAAQLKGIEDAVSGDNMRSSSEKYWRMACDLALPYHGKKPGITWHYVYNENGRVPMYSLKLTEMYPEGSIHILETSESDQLINIVYEWNLLVENDMKGKESQSETETVF